MLRALFYPYARCLDEATLKRAVLLYDEIVFVDAMTDADRDYLNATTGSQIGTFDPAIIAIDDRQVASKWGTMRWYYKELVDAKIIRVVDPSVLTTLPSIEESVRSSLSADLVDPVSVALVGIERPRWELLATRVPPTTRSLLEREGEFYEGDPRHVTRRAREEHQFDAPSHGRHLFGRPTLETEHGYSETVVIPAFAGLSLTTTVALAVADREEAVPLTDDNAHYRFMARRFQRAATALPEGLEIPGIIPSRPSASPLQTSFVQARFLATFLTDALLDRLSLTDCLDLREDLRDERRYFQEYLSSAEHQIRTDVWSPDAERDVSEQLRLAESALSEQRAKTRTALARFIQKTAIAGLVTSPVVLSLAVFPSVSPVLALLLGGGGAIGAGAQEALSALAHGTNPQRNGLSYLLAVEQADPARRRFLS